jgi:small subunit ribosomal protein S2
MRELLEAGVHFGHQTRRWNPKMRRFIFAERGGIYIIDLQKTLELLEEAHDFARNVAERRGTMLFVGTKKQAQDAVRDHATRVGMPYVSNRWLGGLLTNWRTISERIAYLHDLRRLQTEGQLELLPSKERITLTGELEKLEANLGGVADMKRQPDAVFVIDLKKEQLAVREARRLGVPIVGLVDTNADPDEADFVIPGNDDAIRASNLIAKVVADGIAAGQAMVGAEEFTPAVEQAPPDSPDDVASDPQTETPSSEAPAAQPEPAAQAAQRASAATAAERGPEPAAVAADGGDDQ